MTVVSMHCHTDAFVLLNTFSQFYLTYDFRKNLKVLKNIKLLVDE